MNLKEGNKIGVKSSSPYMRNSHYFYEVTIKEITKGGLIITDNGIFDENCRNINDPDEYLCYISDKDREEMARDKLHRHIRDNLDKNLARLSLEEMKAVNNMLEKK
jgi:hypothetical protein